MDKLNMACIAADYCSKAIEINLKHIAVPKTYTVRRNTVSARRKSKKYILGRQRTSPSIRLGYDRERHKNLEMARNKLAHWDKTVDFDISDDKQLNDYLFKIYTAKLDNDKYGINKRI